jgi:hypothetical protein
MSPIVTSSDGSSRAPNGSSREKGSARVRAVDGLRSFARRQWVAAGAGAIATVLVIGIPTAVIPNPVFGRPVEVTWWAPWVLLATALLGGLVMATYVAHRKQVDPLAANGDDLDRPGRLAGLGGLLGFLAVGCPVCNKLVVVALGTTGALQWFAPLQPLLAVGGVVALAVALRVRLRGLVACPTT